MDNKFCIKGPRQLRAVTAVLEKPISVKEMANISGALNPRQVIFELRQQGFGRIIQTRRFKVIDQDGKRCHPGEYFIPEEFKGAVEIALKEHKSAVCSKKLAIQNYQTSTENDKENI